MHLSAWNGHVDCVELFLKHGVNPNLKDHQVGGPVDSGVQSFRGNG